MFCLPIGYSAADTDSAATAVATAAPPRRKDEIRIETPLFLSAETMKTQTEGRFVRPPFSRNSDAMVKAPIWKSNLKAIENVNANHSQYLASLSSFRVENKCEYLRNLTPHGFKALLSKRSSNESPRGPISCLLI